MTALQARQETLAVALWPRQGTLGEMNSALRAVLLAVLGSLLLWACAKIQVPFYPVPVTMTTFAVLAIGMAYGWRLGAATVLLYLAEGAAGLPVFAGTPEKGLGLAYMVGPTGGYLVGYVLAAAACGGLAERGWDRNVVTAVLAMLIGNVLIYLPGLFWLGILFGWDKPILEWGLIPFIPGDLLKLALVAVSLPLAWKLLQRFR
ncbi:biotin transporter BioY [Pelagibius sp.]|uniref:biotin transporter BioY n=1 Tax=Pelagibius sp. TaxID=1931238 RepID=UPI002610321D|nr:biotin transporter BioY [Pelagibius sp.]